jgi:AmmeMemoRadiSam system protein B
MENLSPVRPSPIAGSWYPGDAERLKATVSQYVDQARLQPLPGEVIGLISPHAGYIYSGATAGYAYRAVQGKSYDIVVVASPLHDYRPEPFLTSAHEAYGTPLGTIAINQPLLTTLQEDLAINLGFEMTPIGYDREHSLEIQLPFLQYALAAPFELLPIMVREYRPEPLQAFAFSLARELDGKKALLVASTDLSHFYDEDTANRLDRYMLEQISGFSPEGVIRAEEEGKGFACGNGAVALVLWTALELGGKSVTVLHHSTSAKTTGDRSQVVGYGAAAICG